jgi:hypothetical protein
MNWLNFAKGFKTFIGGAVLVAGGAAGIAFGFVDPMTGVGMIGTGFSVWGIGGKAQDIAQQVERWADAKEKEIKINVPKND